MAFRILSEPLKGLFVIEPDVFRDPRGYFMETFNKESFRTIGLEPAFVQDNLSYSTKGILRGLHFQAPPYAQGKLVSVLRGEVLDVAVDIRKGSPTYGKWFGEVLSETNHLMMYIPPGFAHGFYVLSDECYFSYKCTQVYHKPSDGGIFWNDPAIGIHWNAQEPLVSDKDKVLPLLQDFNSPFEYL